MEWTWKKILTTLGVFIGVFVLPFYLCSNGMMDYYQKRIDRDPNTNFSKWLQIKSADVCYATMRPERSVDYYRRFLERYPNDERRPYAKLRLGLSLEGASRDQDAIRVFEEFLTEYPNHPDKEEANKSVDRIKYVKPK
jgi:outer membrane protein assembly factor BamD (BamD/ComL family)